MKKDKGRFDELLEGGCIGKLTLVESQGNLALITIGPSGYHREGESRALIAYPDAQSLKDATSRLGKRGRKGIEGALEGALCAVVDPDLGLGDFGCDVYGDESAMPDSIIKRAKAVYGPLGHGPGSILAATIAESLSLPAPPVLKHEEILESRHLADALVPEAVRASPEHGTHESIIALIHAGEGFLGLVDRAGMKWETAAKSALRQGAYGGIPDSDNDDRARLIVTRPTSARAPSGLPVVTAKRAARVPNGTRPARASTGRPPSDAQISYALAIAQELGIEYPPDIRSRDEVSRFIETHKDAHREAANARRAAKDTARQAT